MIWYSSKTSKDLIEKVVKLSSMETPALQQSFRKKQMKKQLTGKRDDSALHSAARSGNLELILEIISATEGEELRELVSKQNQSGETALYVAAECGHFDLVQEMVKHYDVGSAAIKSKNGFDAFHIAAKLGELGMHLFSFSFVN